MLLGLGQHARHVGRVLHQQAKGKKAVKPVKAKKVKLVRDSYAMPENEYAQIGELKKRLEAMSVDVKKSELLRVPARTKAEEDRSEPRTVG